MIFFVLFVHLITNNNVWIEIDDDENIEKIKIKIEGEKKCYVLFNLQHDNASVCVCGW
mgnify:CR=1 FL=1